MDSPDLTTLKSLLRDFLETAENQIAVGAETFVPSRLKLSIPSPLYARRSDLELQEKLQFYLTEYAQERGFTLAEAPSYIAIEESQGGKATISTMPGSTAHPSARSVLPSAPRQRKLILKIRGREGIPFDRDACAIGRAADSDLPFQDSRVSSRHCTIFREGGDIFIIDDGSTNGTWLNGAKIQRKTLLRNRDVLEIGGQVIDVSLN